MHDIPLLHKEPFIFYHGREGGLVETRGDHHKKGRPKGEQPR